METLKSNGNGVTESLLENRAEDQHHQSNVVSWWRRLFILYFVENTVGIRLLQNTEVLYLYEYFIDFYMLIWNTLNKKETQTTLICDGPNY